MDVVDVILGFVGVILEVEVDLGGVFICVEVVFVDVVFIGDVLNVKLVDDVLFGVVVGVLKINLVFVVFVVFVFVVDGDLKIKFLEEVVELVVVVVLNIKLLVVGILLVVIFLKVNFDLFKVIMNMYFSKNFLICIFCFFINFKFLMSKNILNSEVLFFSVIFKIVYINLLK